VREKADSEEKERAAKSKKKKKDGEELQVMHFHLKVEDGLAVVGSGGKGKQDGEEGLRSKFGQEGYEKVREEFEQALRMWRGDEDEINQKAFGWYEAFRPEVKSGQKGWGRKGELDLEKVKRVIGRGSDMDICQK
jgi:hypothetical protein